MASALLAIPNEPSWGESMVCMKKIPNSNPNPRAAPFPLAYRSSNRNADRAAGFCPMDVEEVSPSLGAAPVAPSPFGRKSMNLGRCRGGHGDGCGRRIVVFKISTYSRRELKDLKRRLESELDQVKGAIRRVEKQERQLPARTTGVNFSDAFQGNLDPSMRRTFDSRATKEKKAQKREISLVIPESEKMLRAMMNKCGEILARLMKHKKCVWFNSPVDAVAMGLHDYHLIVKNPMDLGTVKSRLSMGSYPSPEAFASDIRLTFKNALLYNPQGYEVHKLAGRLLEQFEESFQPAFHKYEKKRREEESMRRERHKVLSRTPLSLPGTAMIPEPPPLTQVKAIMSKPRTNSAPSSTHLTPIIEFRTPQPPRQQPEIQLQHRASIVARTSRFPKPKAKDLNKRPMSFEEKQKLTLGLQNLPHEKVSQVVQIVRKRKVETMQTEDEIELDIQAMDTETLWELHQFLSNCNKTTSKMRRQEAEVGLPISIQPAKLDHLLVARAESIDGSTVPAEPEAEVMKTDKIVPAEPEAAVLKTHNMVGIDEDEDVDIGDELPSTNYPSVEIEKDDGCASSSSSESSSSSDSDSGSDGSSGSDSDEDGKKCT